MAVAPQPLYPQTPEKRKGLYENGDVLLLVE
jgi:hypothetical protein